MRLTAALLGLTTAVGLTCSAGAAGPVARQARRTPPFVLTALSLELTVDYERPSIDGTTALTILNGGDHSETEVPILLNRLMTIRSVTARDGRDLEWQSAVSVFVDSPFKQAVAARVLLPSPLPPRGKHDAARAARRSACRVRRNREPVHQGSD